MQSAQFQKTQTILMRDDEEKSVFYGDVTGIEKADKHGKRTDLGLEVIYLSALFFFGIQWDSHS